jgi:plasmid stabilization system protein ParE
MSLSWSQRARVDLLAIGDYIATGNPSAARAWVERLREVAALGWSTVLSLMESSC